MGQTFKKLMQNLKNEEFMETAIHSIDDKTEITPEFEENYQEYQKNSNHRNREE